MSTMGSRVRVSSRHPQAAAVCDRCGLWRNHADLARQMRYAGAQVVWSGLLVCPDTCLDPLDPFDRARIVPPDGLPIRNPRPEPYATDFLREISSESGVSLASEGGIPLIADDDTGSAPELVGTDDGSGVVADDGSFIPVDLSGG